jgi:hypothetical protein
MRMEPPGIGCVSKTKVRVRVYCSSHPTGRERMGSPTLQALQEPTVLPWLSAFEVAAFDTQRVSVSSVESGRDRHEGAWRDWR